MKCKTCENAVFDECWGEWKCKIWHIRCEKCEKTTNCDKYKEKK